MAFGYLMLLLLLAGLSGSAGVLWKLGWSLWKTPRRRVAAVLLLLLALLAAAAALYFLKILWREPPWRFHF